jgi:hypothetical protein
MEFTEFLPIIYLAVIITGAYFIGKLCLTHFQKLKSVKRSIEAPQMYAKVMAELQYLKENGADEKQMASLQRKADLLKTVVDNQEIINIAGKPIIKYVGKLLSGFGR